MGRGPSGTLFWALSWPTREALEPVISGATSCVLVLVLAGGLPADRTLPPTTGVGFFRGNHGNTFVSEAWCLPPSLPSLQERPRKLLLSPCTSLAVADCGPRGQGTSLWMGEGAPDVAWAPPLSQSPTHSLTHIPIFIGGTEHLLWVPEVTKACPALQAPDPTRVTCGESPRCWRWGTSSEEKRTPTVGWLCGGGDAERNLRMC